VVASEVRSLAQRSASAAKEIKDLIHDSVEKVEEGSRLVSESGRHLHEIVASVKKVSDVVGEISNASQEQAASAEEISRAVTQMDESTQQNAAMVEEANAAAASMNDQATRLSELTAFFKLRDGAAVASNGTEAHSQIQAQIQARMQTDAAKLQASRASRAPALPAVTRPSAVFASAAAAAAESSEQGERRSALRPWSGQEAPTSSAAKMRTVTSTSSDWSEF
jgi:uncharacterized phage infection (PIP) family protein YhgE